MLYYAVKKGKKFHDVDGNWSKLGIDTHFMGKTHAKNEIALLVDEGMKCSLAKVELTLDEVQEVN